MPPNWSAPKTLVAVSAALPVAVVVLALVHAPSWLTASSVGLLVTTLFVLTMRVVRVDAWTIAIQLAALGCYLIYFSYTSPDERTPDAIAQMRYIAYLEKHFSPPPMSECVVCHHPPLYYLLAVGMSRLTGWTQVCPGQRGLQVLSLLFALGVLAHVPLILRRYLPSVAAIRLGTALVGFWPSTVMQSCRIHNDSLATLVILVGVYWLIRWYQDRGAWELALASTFAGLSIWVKSSGYVLVGTLGCIFLWRLLVLARSPRLCVRRLWPIVFVIASAAALHIIDRSGSNAASQRAIDRASPNAVACQRMFGRACSIRWTRLPNDLATYAYFDLKGFGDSPYLVVGRSNTEHKYFLNCVLKSSLFGAQNSQPDAETARGINPRIARLLNHVLLAILSYTVLTFFAVARTWVKRHALQLVYVGIAVALMIAFRYIVPNPHHSDFRHIQPVLVLGVVVFMDAVEWHRVKRPALAHVGVALAGLMILGSLVYWLPK